MVQSQAALLRYPTLRRRHIGSWVLCLGLSTGAGPYGLPVGLPMGVPVKTLTCRSRLPVAAGP
jgi:hypothetical protein